MRQGSIHCLHTNARDCTHFQIQTLNRSFEQNTIRRLTNLKSLTKSSRRRDSTSTSQAEDSSANTRSKKMPKVPVIKMADLLQAATESSGSGSAGEGEEPDGKVVLTSSLFRYIIVTY